MSDGVPLLMIASAPPLRELETNEMQGGLDQVAAATPVTKWAHRVVATERIPDLVALAVRKALSGRPGPVFQKSRSTYSSRPSMRTATATPVRRSSPITPRRPAAPCAPPLIYCRTRSAQR